MSTRTERDRRARRGSGDILGRSEPVRWAFAIATIACHSRRSRALAIIRSAAPSTPATVRCRSGQSTHRAGRRRDRRWPARRELAVLSRRLGTPQHERQMSSRPAIELHCGGGQQDSCPPHDRRQHEPVVERTFPTGARRHGARRPGDLRRVSALRDAIARRAANGATWSRSHSTHLQDARRSVGKSGRAPSPTTTPRAGVANALTPAPSGPRGTAVGTGIAPTASAISVRELARLPDQPFVGAPTLRRAVRRWTTLSAVGSPARRRRRAFNCQRHRWRVGSRAGLDSLRLPANEAGSDHARQVNRHRRGHMRWHQGSNDTAVAMRAPRALRSTFSVRSPSATAAVGALLTGTSTHARVPVEVPTSPGPPSSTERSSCGHRAHPPPSLRPAAAAIAIWRWTDSPCAKQPGAAASTKPSRAAIESSFARGWSAFAVEDAWVPGRGRTLA